MTETFEEFNPTHDFFDYTGSHWRMDFSSLRRSRWTRIRIPFSKETWRSKRNACWKT